MGFSKIKILGIFSENPERPPNTEKKILGNFRVYYLMWFYYIYLYETNRYINRSRVRFVR